MAYRLKKDGQVVHVYRSTTLSPRGQEIHLTRGVVGHAGQVFEELPPHVADPIEAGEMDDLWEIVDLEAEAQATSPSSKKADPGPPDPRAKYEAMKNEELQKLVVDRGMEVTGTGAQGNIVKDDMISALVADDEKGD